MDLGDKQVKKHGSEKGAFGGYFTVEASLILVIVLFVQLGLVRLLLFQADRCRLEQELEHIILKAGYGLELSNEERLRVLRAEADRTGEEDYFYFSSVDVGIRIRGRQLELSGGAEGGEWDYACERSIVSFPPKIVLRLVRRAGQNPENEEIE